MKNNLLLVLLIVAGCFAHGDLARAQILTNGDFKMSAKPAGTDKITTGFASIPGWKNIGTAAKNSGIQYGTPGNVPKS